MQQRPHPNRAELPASPKFLDLLIHMPAHSIRNDNQISHGDQTGCQEKFHRDGRPQIPSGDLFVVADLLVCLELFLSAKPSYPKGPSENVTCDAFTCYSSLPMVCVEMTP